jgi:hypothetical protein
MRSRQAPANRPLNGYRWPTVDMALFVQQIEGPRLGKRTVARTGMARMGAPERNADSHGYR